MSARVAEPIAITGAGVVTPIGHDLDAFWAGLVTGVSGVSEIERFPVRDLRVTRGGEVKKLPRWPQADAPPACRVSGFLIHAAREALAQAGLATDRPEAGRIAVVVGTALGGIDDAERVVRGQGGLRGLLGALYDGPRGTWPAGCGRGPV
jgi:3-oxoacyl-[acyl-carrier-protein] synthase II